MPVSGPPIPDKNTVQSLLDALRAGARFAEDGDHLQVLVDGAWEDRWLELVAGAWRLSASPGVYLTRNTFDLLYIGSAGEEGGFRATGVLFALEPVPSGSAIWAKASAL